MAKRVALMLGDGFETIEALATADILTRGGLEVMLISVMESPDVVSAQNIPVHGDTVLNDITLDGFDMIIVPGGSVGVENLSRSEDLKEALRAFMAEGKLVGSICAGPSILADLGLLEGRQATCYPGWDKDFPDGVRPDELGVYTDGNLITASGPGFSIPFGLACLEAIAGGEVREDVAKAMLITEA